SILHPPSSTSQRLCVGTGDSRCVLENRALSFAISDLGRRSPPLPQHSRPRFPRIDAASTLYPGCPNPVPLGPTAHLQLPGRLRVSLAPAGDAGWCSRPPPVLPLGAEGSARPRRRFGSRHPGSVLLPSSPQLRGKTVRQRSTHICRLALPGRELPPAAPTHPVARATDGLRAARRRLLLSLGLHRWQYQPRALAVALEADRLEG